YKNNEVYKEFSSTSLNANAKVPHRSSSHGGATDNPTQKDLTDQEDLLKNTELDKETTQDATHLSPLEQANAEKHELTLKTMQKMHKTKHKMKL
ncbi:DUF3519 domain-containing protein, partial [Helicobacter pylori]